MPINVDTGSHGYEYSALITLNVADLAIFATKMIKKFRLYIYYEEVSEIDAEKFKIMVKCIKTAKWNCRAD